jgi:hypothetical protein
VGARNEGCPRKPQCYEVAPMKLDRLPTFVAVGFAAFALAACGSAQTPKQAKAPTSAIPSTVGTTQLMAAEMQVEPEALKVGKAQHSQTNVTDEVVQEDELTVKDPPRRENSRKGGGFSGWK